MEKISEEIAGGEPVESPKEMMATYFSMANTAVSAKVRETVYQCSFEVPYKVTRIEVIEPAYDKDGEPVKFTAMEPGETRYKIEIKFPFDAGSIRGEVDLKVDPHRDSTLADLPDQILKRIGLALFTLTCQNSED